MTDYKKIKVTITEEFMVPMIDNEKTEINGWTINQVIDDWFNYPADSYHATREGHRIGNSRKFVSTEVLDL